MIKRRKIEINKPEKTSENKKNRKIIIGFYWRKSLKAYRQILHSLSFSYFPVFMSIAFPPFRLKSHKIWPYPSRPSTVHINQGGINVRCRRLFLPQTKTTVPFRAIITGDFWLVERDQSDGKLIRAKESVSLIKSNDQIFLQDRFAFIYFSNAFLAGTISINILTVTV